MVSTLANCEKSAPSPSSQRKDSDSRGLHTRDHRTGGSHSSSSSDGDSKAKASQRQSHSGERKQDNHQVQSTGKRSNHSNEEAGHSGHHRAERH